MAIYSRKDPRAHLPRFLYLYTNIVSWQYFLRFYHGLIWLKRVDEIPTWDVFLIPHIFMVKGLSYNSSCIMKLQEMSVITICLVPLHSDICLLSLGFNKPPLQWRYNERDGVSNHQPHHSGVDQRKHQSSASLAFVRGIHRRPVNSPHKGPVTRKMFPFDDVITSPEATMVPSLPMMMSWRGHHFSLT